MKLKKSKIKEQDFNEDYKMLREELDETDIIEQSKFLIQKIG